MGREEEAVGTAYHYPAIPSRITVRFEVAQNKRRVFPAISGPASINSMSSPFPFLPPEPSSVPTFKFFIPPPYLFPPPFPPHYFCSTVFGPTQFPHFSPLNNPFNSLAPLPTLQCPSCPSSYINPANLMVHMAWHRQQAQQQQHQAVACITSAPTTSNNTGERSANERKSNEPNPTKATASSTGTTRSGNRTRSPQTVACKCSVCGKTFTRHWLLQGHMRTHTGEKPFQCPVCSKAFADKSNLRAHIQTHSGVKPYACQRCGKRFALKSYLSKHEESTCIRSIVKPEKKS